MSPQFTGTGEIDMGGKDNGAGLALLGLGLLPLFILFIVWLIAAGVAAFIADSRGRSSIGFFLVTFFFLGPLGPGFALLAGREINGEPVGPAAAAKPKAVDGRRRFICPRCQADNDIPNAATSYDCWRCSEHRAVKAKPA
ncbi:hypothetical protein H7J08_07845 [Mycobacterium frederiksbergense]|uniref:hypothetical protein n=1 Tax=Mycolicibacterium frederiksbergense TaxID=117567 RepID=UPI0021F28CEC|nr:hypothetical protein [Mycolicibacterium frederiksbergense]MCV7044584.1 hypothetical protein [Mycolicibacterium frederiksbergense]